MTEPFFRTRRAESFSGQERKLAELALCVVGIGACHVLRRKAPAAPSPSTK